MSDLVLFLCLGWAFGILPCVLIFTEDVFGHYRAETGWLEFLVAFSWPISIFRASALLSGFPIDEKVLRLRNVFRRTTTTC